MKRRQPRPAFLDQDQAEACLELWSSKKFDTNDIARILRVPEPAVSRLIQAARDLARVPA